MKNQRIVCLKLFLKLYQILPYFLSLKIKLMSQVVDCVHVMIHHHIRTVSLVPLMFLLLCHFFLLDSPESVFQFYSAWLSVSFRVEDLLCDWMLECFVDVGCIDLSEVYWRQHVLSRCLDAM